MVVQATFQHNPQRQEAEGLSWPLPADLDEIALKRCPVPPSPVRSPVERCLPDWAAIHRERKSRKKATLHLRWEELKQSHPGSYRCSWCRDLYRRWLRQLHVALRHEHRAGKRCSWITRGRRFGGCPPGRAKFAWPRCSSQSWVPEVTPAPKPLRARYLWDWI